MHAKHAIYLSEKCEVALGIILFDKNIFVKKDEKLRKVFSQHFVLNNYFALSLVFDTLPEKVQIPRSI